jgi:hypothetical protein
MPRTAQHNGTHPMAFTLGTASQAIGCAKSTILRAIKAGRISATRDDLGQWQIDPAELFRVFPALAIPGATPQTPPIERDATTDMLVAELRQVISDLRQDRDHWRTALEREQVANAATQRLLLPAPATAPEQDAPAEGEGATAPKRRATGSCALGAGCARPDALRARACCSSWRPGLLALSNSSSSSRNSSSRRDASRLR